MVFVVLLVTGLLVLIPYCFNLVFQFRIAHILLIKSNVEIKIDLLGENFVRLIKESFSGKDWYKKEWSPHIFDDSSPYLLNSFYCLLLILMQN
jgi:hypothetical protein